jgi:hypothetical protein
MRPKSPRSLCQPSRCASNPTRVRVFWPGSRAGGHFAHSGHVFAKRGRTIRSRTRRH